MRYNWEQVIWPLIGCLGCNKSSRRKQARRRQKLRDGRAEAALGCLTSGAEAAVGCLRIAAEAAVGVVRRGADAAVGSSKRG